METTFNFCSIWHIGISEHVHTAMLLSMITALLGTAITLVAQALFVKLAMPLSDSFTDVSRKVTFPERRFPEKNFVSEF